MVQKKLGDYGKRSPAKKPAAKPAAKPAGKPAPRSVPKKSAATPALKKKR